MPLSVSQIFAQRDVTPQNQQPGPKREEVVKMQEPVKVTIQFTEMSLCWENCEFQNLVWLFGRSVVSGSLWPHGLQPARLLCPWDPPGKNTGVGCHALLQGHLPDSGTEPTHSALQADALSVSCYDQVNPVNQNNKKVWKYIFWPFQHSFAVSPMKEHALFVYILCIQTVTKNLKCYYLEIYLKYLSCFAEDVMLIFFFSSWEWE